MESSFGVDGVDSFGIDGSETSTGSGLELLRFHLSLSVTYAHIEFPEDNLEVAFTCERRGHIFATEPVTVSHEKPEASFTESLELNVCAFRQPGCDSLLLDDGGEESSMAPQNAKQLDGLERIVARVTFREVEKEDEEGDMTSDSRVATGAVVDCAAVDLAQFIVASKGQYEMRTTMQLGSRVVLTGVCTLQQPMRAEMEARTATNNCRSDCTGIVAESLGGGHLTYTGQDCGTPEDSTGVENENDEQEEGEDIGDDDVVCYVHQEGTGSGAVNPRMRRPTKRISVISTSSSSYPDEDTSGDTDGGEFVTTSISKTGNDERCPSAAQMRGVGSGLPRVSGECRGAVEEVMQRDDVARHASDILSSDEERIEVPENMVTNTGLTDDEEEGTENEMRGIGDWHDVDGEHPARREQPLMRSGQGAPHDVTQDSPMSALWDENAGEDGERPDDNSEIAESEEAVAETNMADTVFDAENESHSFSGQERKHDEDTGKDTKRNAAIDDQLRLCEHTSAVRPRHKNADHHFSELITSQHTLPPHETTTDEGRWIERPVVSKVSTPFPIRIWSILGPHEADENDSYDDDSSSSDSGMMHIGDGVMAPKRNISRLQAAATASPVRHGLPAPAGAMSPLQRTYLVPSDVPEAVSIALGRPRDVSKRTALAAARGGLTGEAHREVVDDPDGLTASEEEDEDDGDVSTTNSDESFAIDLNEGRTEFDEDKGSAASSDESFAVDLGEGQAKLEDGEEIDELMGLTRKMTRRQLSSLSVAEEEERQMEMRQQEQEQELSMRVSELQAECVGVGLMVKQSRALVRKLRDERNELKAQVDSVDLRMYEIDASETEMEAAVAEKRKTVAEMRFANDSLVAETEELRLSAKAMREEARKVGKEIGQFEGLEGENERLTKVVESLKRELLIGEERRKAVELLVMAKSELAMEKACCEELRHQITKAKGTGGGGIGGFFKKGKLGSVGVGGGR